MHVVGGSALLSRSEMVEPQNCADGIGDVDGERLGHFCRYALERSDMALLRRSGCTIAVYRAGQRAIVTLHGGL